VKLLSYPTSPFARKVRIAAIEVGVDDRMEIVHANPLAADGLVTTQNPLGKIPVLILDECTLVDSSLICAYLDRLHDGPKLQPDGDWRTLQLQALGDGMMDALVRRRLEMCRPEALRSAYWLARYEASVHRTLREVAIQISAWREDTFTIGSISVGCALWYLDRRYAEMKWRDREPELAAWFEVWSARPAVTATEPPYGYPGAAEVLQADDSQT
jgi:glutathione S-transferase